MGIRKYMACSVQVTKRYEAGYISRVKWWYCKGAFHQIIGRIAGIAISIAAVIAILFAAAYNQQYDKKKQYSK